MSDKSSFADFTKKYALSKTLRFELKPYGEILEEKRQKYDNCSTFTEYHLKKINQDYYNEEKSKNLNLEIVNFLKDQEIEDAYQTLKPVFDTIHEEFITQSLESEESKKIDFSNYLELKKKLNSLKKKKSSLNKESQSKEIKEVEKEIEKLENDKGEISKTENDLRKFFEELYKKSGDDLKTRINGVDLPQEEEGESNSTQDENKEEKSKGFRKLLTAKILLEYIKNNTKVKKEDKTEEETGEQKKDKFIIYTDDKTKEKIENALLKFKGFSTYFKGFDTNRLNYYETKKEASTAVATRIVNENLPKFVDNIFLFEKQKDEYSKIYGDLKNANKELKIKDKKGNEKKVIKFYDEIFTINYFTNCLSQNQIDEYNEKIGDNNFLINLYNQLHSKTEGFKKLPQFKILYKQIGCGEKNDFVKLIKKDEELMEKLKEIRLAGEKYFIGEKKEGEEKHTIYDFINSLQNRENYEGIYWNKQAINTISGKYFANWHDLQDKLVTEKIFKEDKKSDEKIKIPDAIELSSLFSVLDNEMKDSKTNSEGQKNWKDSGFFFKSSLFEGERKERNIKIIQKANKPSKVLLTLILDDLKVSTKKFLKNNTVIENGVVKIVDFKNDIEKSKIKLWLDETITINRILKYFITKENKRKGHQQDSDIENLLKVLIFDFDWFKSYDAIRNYLTKKPQSEINKLKLNFEKPTIALGWDLNKESENFCVILQDDKKILYLAILRKEYNQIFEKKLYNGKGKNKEEIANYIFNDNGEWKKMEYKQIAAPTGIGGFVRKCFNSGKQYGWECPRNCLNKEGKIIIKNEEAEGVLKELIDCYKDFFNKYEKDGFKYKDYNFKFKESDKYGTLNEFFEDVENQSYKLAFINILKSEVDVLVKEGKIFLFMIKNQDYNQNKKDEHKSNLHTLYWKAIFGDNENKPKLNGDAELFYRPALSIDKMKKATKSNKDGDKVEVKLKNGETAIKNFRFSKEKFVFHCPIKLNYKSKTYSKPIFAINEINNGINKELTKSESSQDICFLGIDRGEKHLAYYSLVNQKGEIIKQGTLNIPFLDENKNPRSIKVEKKSFSRDTSGKIEKDEKGNEKIKTEIVECWNYNDLLEARSGDRDFARKNWQTIGTIKELKDGYISQVVRKIVDLAIEHNAFIVLENLNSGFKNSRKKIEKQVYQKLELALAKKLNFVVDKSVKSGDIMSVENALQLTPPVNNFGDIEKSKQYGIMLYTRANYTSQTDPKTGWRKSIYLKKGSEESIKAQICENFDEFGFDGQDYYFRYIDKNTGKKKILYSGKNGKSLERYRGKLNNDTNMWEINLIDIVAYLDELFQKYGKGKEFKFTIQEPKKDKQGKVTESGLIKDLHGKEIELVKIEDKKLNPDLHTAWETFRYIIELIQQIRNTGDKGDKRNEDFILSPVRDEKTGEHFDSRYYYKEDGNYEDVKEVVSGDANGAFNIARKGIMMFERIKQNTEKPELFIRDEEWDKVVSDWDNFTQK